MFPLKNSRLWMLCLTGLICGAAGWWLHGPIRSRASAGTAGIQSQSASGNAAARTSPASAKNSASRSGIDSLGESPDAALQTRIAETMERVFNTDPEDLVEMMEGFGSLTRMSDDEVRMAWNQLSRRVPSNNFGGGLTALYLWNRMWQMGEKVELPTGWGVEDFEVALASEKARHGGEQGSEQLLQRLESGESLSDTERRVLFGHAVRANPLEAVKLWCRVTEPGEYHRDAAWLYSALTEPASRDAIMSELRKWQTKENLAGTVASLARNWMDRDPEAVEKWLQQPAQADIKDAVMQEIITTRARSNPVETWTWSQNLPEAQRRQALALSAAQFASYGSEEAEIGIRFIAQLQDPSDRLEAVGKFGGILAAKDIERWIQWRDTLAPAEQDRVKELAFDYWASSDVDAAVDWLGTRPSGAAKDQMITKLASLYAQNAPDTAVQWIRRIEDTTRRQEAVSVALTSVGPGNLELIQALLNGLSRN